MGTLHAIGDRINVLWKPPGTNTSFCLVGTTTEGHHGHERVGTSCGMIHPSAMTGPADRIR